MTQSVAPRRTSKRPTRRSVTVSAFLMAGITAAALAVPSTASADPNPSSLTLTQAQAALTDIQHQQGAAVEAFNQARVKADQAKVEVATAAAAVTKEQASYDQAAAATAKLAAVQYETGGLADSLVGMVSANNPDVYLSGAALTSQVDRNRAQAMIALKTSKTRLDSAKQVADSKQAAATALATQAKQAQAAIDAKAADAQRLVDNLSEQARQALLAQQAAEAANAAAQRAAAAAAAAALRPTSTVAVPAGRSGSAVQNARAVMGAPYQYGAAGPSSFDCSGLVQWSFARAGISLPRTATDQYYATRRISAGDLQPGDLIFFNFGGGSIEHVGIYSGGGMMIDAPHTGSYVGERAIYSGVYGYGRV